MEQGNYIKTKTKPVIVSPIGAIKKERNEVRIIHDASRPSGSAMNDYGNPVSVSYQSVNDACELANQGSYLAKIDLKSAYRSVPINPADYPLTGLRWHFNDEEEPSYLYDVKLPFGSNAGPAIFSRITNSIQRMMKRRGFTIIVYLDDFLICEHSYSRCREAQLILLNLLGQLGFYVSWHKVVGPSQLVQFLGININTVDCTLSLDQLKVSKLESKLLCFKSRKRANKRQLQSLAGSLNWACQCVRGGRHFLRRILNIMNCLKMPSHKCKLSKEFQKDVTWWLSALEKFNGVVYYRSVKTLVVHTDACGDGAGMFCGGDWWYVNWGVDNDDFKNMHINNKEILAVTSAATHWAEHWQNSDIIVYTDSSVAKSVINKGSCRNEKVMDALRDMFWLMVKFNFRLRAVHIPGKLNQMADVISRLHEPGQILHLQSLLNNWHHNNGYTIEWNNHMSVASLQLLVPQIIKWSDRLS